MAALAPTPANVVPGADATYHDALAGEAIDAGEACYIDESDASKAKLADANASETTAKRKGVAVNSAGAGQPVRIATGGTVAGFGAVQGTIYVLGATPGAIHPAADLVTGWYVSIVGVGTSTGGLKLLGSASGIAVP